MSNIDNNRFTNDKFDIEFDRFDNRISNLVIIFKNCSR